MAGFPTGLPLPAYHVGREALNSIARNAVAQLAVEPQPAMDIYVGIQLAGGFIALCDRTFMYADDLKYPGVLRDLVNNTVVVRTERDPQTPHLYNVRATFDALQVAHVQAYAGLRSFSVSELRDMPRLDLADSSIDALFEEGKLEQYCDGKTRDENSEELIWAEKIAENKAIVRAIVTWEAGVYIVEKILLGPVVLVR